MFICYRRLEEQAAIQRDLCNILPVAKLFSLRLRFIPPALLAITPSNSLIAPSVNILAILQQAANTSTEQPAKRPRLESALPVDGLAESLSELGTPTLKGLHQSASSLSPPPPFSTNSSRVHFSSELDVQSDEVALSRVSHALAVLQSHALTLPHQQRRRSRRAKWVWGFGLTASFRRVFHHRRLRHQSQSLLRHQGSVRSVRPHHGTWGCHNPPDFWNESADLLRRRQDSIPHA